MNDQSQSTETKIALMKQSIEAIAVNVNEIRLDIKSLSNVFVQTTTYQEEKKAQDLRLLALEKSSFLWRWLSPSLAAVLGSVLTFLIVSFLNNIK